MKNIKFPNLFLVGFPKTGTTSLYKALSSLTSIYAPSAKEHGDLNLLMKIKEGDSISTDIYLKNYKNATSEKYMIDGQVKYSINLEAAKIIKDINPNSKIIIGLREPISFIKSYFNQIEKNKNMSKTDTLFKIDYNKELLKKEYEFLNINFLDIIKSYIQYFGKDSVYIYVFDDLISNREYFLEELLIFLDLDSEENKISIKKNFHHINPSLVNMDIWRKKVDHNLKHQYFFRILRDLLKKIINEKNRIKLDFIKNKFLYGINSEVKLKEELIYEYKKIYYYQIEEISEIIKKDLIKLWNY